MAGVKVCEIILIRHFFILSVAFATSMKVLPCKVSKHEQMMYLLFDGGFVVENIYDGKVVAFKIVECICFTPGNELRS